MPNQSKKKLLPVCLVIMDGYGLDDSKEGNAIAHACTPVLDNLFAHNSQTKLEASGEAVGLPSGQMGNSEVGHLNIGAGRIVYQELTRINKACDEGLLDQRTVITDAFEAAKNEGAVLHLMGLLSDGGVHSSNKHLYALIDRAIDVGVPRVFIHCFMDGRDVPPQSGKGFIEELEYEISLRKNDTTHIEIASISGRYYAMDRDKRWERVEQAYKTLVEAIPFKNVSATDLMQQSYDAGVTDEFVIPTALNERGMESGDSVLFFNFRPDRAREITRALVDDGFSYFARSKKVALNFVCLTEYDPTIPAPIAFEKEFPQNVLADVLSEFGLKQYHIAETEKYAHVTFFLNGGVEQPKAGETRKLIASPKVATYDLQPEMSEPEVADTLAEAIRADEADVYIVNFANCDMVGHTGSFDAAVRAVEAVDEGVGLVCEAIKEKDGIVLLTADHGNADKMTDEQGKPFTAHTTALVPLVLVDFSGNNLKLNGTTGALSNIAPTLLEIIGLDKPQSMEAKSLLA